MPAIVSPSDPGALGYGGVRSADPVRGIQWSAVARALNFLNGSSRCLIPYSALGSFSTSSAFAWRVFPSYQATHRLWHVVFTATADDEAMPDSVDLTDPSGGTATLDTLGGGFSVGTREFFHVETVSSRTTSETTLTLTLEPSSGFVRAHVSCWELPRRELALDTNDLGLEVASFLADAPIYDATGYSLGALPEALAGALSRGRRHLFQWARRATTSGAFSTTSTSYTPILAFTPELLERFLYNGETNPACEARALAWVTGGTGNVRISMSHGHVASTTVSATTPTWVSLAPQVRAEDLATSDGRRTSADLATIEARKNTSGTIYVAGIGIFGRAS